MLLVALGTVVQNSLAIANGQTTSSTISTNGSSLVGVQIPAAFTGTSITFLAAMASGGPFQPVYNGAGQVKYNVVEGQYIAINPQDFYGIPFLQIVSSASEGAARTLICSMKGI
jgi:hypothetical protein